MKQRKYDLQLDTLKAYKDFIFMVVFMVLNPHLLKQDHKFTTELGWKRQAQVDPWQGIKAAANRYKQEFKHLFNTLKV